MVGHKSKLCSYYHWGGGQGRLSKLRHDKTRDNFNIDNFQNINSGVFVNHVQCLTFGHLNVRSLLPKIDEIRCTLNSHHFWCFCCVWILAEPYNNGFWNCCKWVWSPPERPTELDWWLCVFICKEWFYVYCKQWFDVWRCWGFMEWAEVRLNEFINIRNLQTAFQWVFSL